MSLVELHRDPTDGARVLALPAWIPPARDPGAYWHQPRSATLRDGGARMWIHFWCGQARSVAPAELVATSTPPPDMKCGTCVGRRAGYDRTDGVIFRPRDHWQLPRVCPSSTPDPTDLRLCFACGRKTNAARGWNAYGLAQHAPDPELAARYEPCPQHGWTRMYVYGGFDQPYLVCTSFRCTYRPERMGP